MNSISTQQLFIVDEISFGRNPRFMKGGIQSIVRQMKKGRDHILRTYTKQFLANWRVNYEFILRSYFPASMDSSDNRYASKNKV